MSNDSFLEAEQARSGGVQTCFFYLLRVPEVSPEGVVNARRGLLWVTGHGFNKHLEGALQQHVHAAVVIIIVAAQV